MKSLNLKLGLLLFSLFLCWGCSEKEFFYQFHSLSDSAWNKDDVGKFEVEVTDTLSHYNVYIEIRNNDNYSFRNLWLFVTFETPDGRVRTDTLNCELADVQGKWYGTGISLYELSIPYEESFNFPRSGKYTYSIKHGMRADNLKGISDIGIKIVAK